MAGADSAKPNPDPARLAACRLLYDVLESGAYTNLAAIRKLDDAALNSRDRAFASALVYGTISSVPALDWYLDRLSDRPVKKLDPWLRTILRLGLWQILYSHSVPTAAAVDESVELARHCLNKGAASYTNAVLRAYERKLPELPKRLEAYHYGLTTEMFGLLKKWYGTDQARLIAKSAHETQPWTNLRVNMLRADPESLAIKWQQDQLAVQRGRYLKEAIAIQLSGNSIRDLAAWQDGLVSVQDEAAMLVAEIAAPEPGDTIIDLCAAPGGKSAHLAEKMKNTGRIIAVDNQSHRLDLLSESMERLGIHIVEPVLADAATVFLPDPADPADDDDPSRLPEKSARLVLADVPCSGLGLLARKPEIRLNMTYERIMELLPLQARILRHAARLVRPGGYLIYSTCTINPQENQLQIDHFLDQTQGKIFDRCGLTDELPPALLAQDPELAVQAEQGWVQLLPHRHAVDGFFICKLQRRSHAQLF